MVDLYKDNPEWLEIKLNGATSDDIEQLKLKYELTLDPRSYMVIFFGYTTKLRAQEYKFLKAILTKNGKRINAVKLMKEIGSQCNPELMQKLSYRIKSKIKKKFKTIASQYVPYEDNDWILLDQSYEQNPAYTTINGTVTHTQKFDFNRIFAMLISVKDGFYYTSFRKLNKNS